MNQAATNSGLLIGKMLKDNNFTLFGKFKKSCRKPLLKLLFKSLLYLALTIDLTK